MSHLQEAYDCLIDNLNQKISELHAEIDRVAFEDVTPIRMLWDFVVEHHGVAAALKLAKQVDVAIEDPGQYESYVKDNYGGKA